MARRVPLAPTGIPEAGAPHRPLLARDDYGASLEAASRAETRGAAQDAGPFFRRAAGVKARPGRAEGVAPMGSGLYDYNEVTEARGPGCSSRQLPLSSARPADDLQRGSPVADAAVIYHWAPSWASWVSARVCRESLRWGWHDDATRGLVILHLGAVRHTLSYAMVPFVRLPSASTLARGV